MKEDDWHEQVVTQSESWWELEHMYLANMVYYELWKDCCRTLISWCKMQTKIQHIKANMIQSSYDWSTIQHNLSINHGISYQFRSQYKAEVWNIPAIPITDADATPQVFSHLHIHHLLVMYPHRPHSRMCKSIASFNMSNDDRLPAKKARWLQHKANSSSLVCLCPYHHH